MTFAGFGLTFAIISFMVFVFLMLIIIGGSRK